MSLLPVSRLIANGALRLGGSYIIWLKAIPCPGLRPGGTPCYDMDSGSYWVDCPVCHGNGMTYAGKRVIRGIYTDNSNQFEPDGAGGLMQGKKTLSLPHELPITLMKESGGGFDDGFSSPRKVLRDKFVVLTPDGKVTETLYMTADPVKPSINSGSIYQIVEVVSNG